MEKCIFSGVQVKLSSTRGSPLKHAEAKQEISHPGDHVASPPLHKGSEKFRKLSESTLLSNRLQSEPPPTITASPCGLILWANVQWLQTPGTKAGCGQVERGTVSPSVIASKGGPGRKPPPQSPRPQTWPIIIPLGVINTF